MSNSSLISYTKLSPNYSSGRINITRITPHCMVGQLSVESCGNIFASKSRKASSNYGIGTDGRIGLYVDEKNRSWCSSSSANDNRAITIECACDLTHPYTMNSKVYNSLINLCVDICHRYSKKKLLWLGNKHAALNYHPQNDEIILTAHRWFSNTACPGDWLYNRLGELADAVNRILGNQTSYAEKYYGASHDSSLEVDGIIGYKTIGKWQEVMQTPIDGEIWGQKKSLKKYLIAVQESCVKYIDEGSDLIKAVQWALKFDEPDRDGILGPKTIKAIQHHLGCKEDGYLGKETAMAIQQQIFQGVF